MSPLVFGVDREPVVAAPIQMAYIGRARCGHIRAMAIERGPRSIGEFIDSGVHGLFIERVPMEVAREEGLGQCADCEPPEQTGLDL